MGYIRVINHLLTFDPNFPEHPSIVFPSSFFHGRTVKNFGGVHGPTGLSELQWWIVLSWEI